MKQSESPMFYIYIYIYIYKDEIEKMLVTLKSPKCLTIVSIWNLMLKLLDLHTK
jgi:hypothetical protein